MRKLEPLKYFAGSFVIYYVMAACSSPGASNPNKGASSSSSGSSSGVSSSSGGSGSSSGTASSSGSSGSPVPDANADQSQSGSRLRANYYVGADGSKQFAYFTDSTLGNAQCTFETASDGSTRCLPTGVTFGSAFYSDATCKTLIAFTEEPCQTDPAYAASYVLVAGVTCTYSQQFRIFPIVGVFNGTTYSLSGGTCTANAAAPTFTFYSLAAELQPSSFVEATIQAE